MYLPENTLALHQDMLDAGLGEAFRHSRTPSPHGPSQNHVLAALPAADIERLERHLELVPLPLGEMLYEPGRPIRHAYFPTTAIVSLHHVMASGVSAETAGVGNEGVVGISLFMGADSMPSSAMVRTAGHAYRLAAGLFKQEFHRAGLMQRLLLRYTQTLITQMIQTAACSQHHTTEEKLCKSLLSAIDQAPSRELVMTQELIASMLGVRREAITLAAGNLRRAGYIRYVRGHFSVLERSGLESRACECYTLLKKELSRLLSDVRYTAQTFLLSSDSGDRPAGMRGH
jgi:CRP-like cAMP-binding protein